MHSPSPPSRLLSVADLPLKGGGGADIIHAARAVGRNSLSEAGAKALLGEFGVATPRSVVVAGTDATDAAAKLKPPFVVKVMSPDILHKSDAGGVAVGLETLNDVRSAIATMAARPQIAGARVDGYLIEEMAPRGREVVIGGINDPQFGPMLMVGLGGVFVEILQDVAFRICPIKERDARAMLEELRGLPLLKGARGQPGVSLDAIIDLLLRIGGEDGLLMRLGDEIAEIDVNPVIVSANGAVAVDARVILASHAGKIGKPVPKSYDDIPVVDRFTPLYAPKTVAVLGASAKSITIANTFIRRVQKFGYQGAIYPIHPSAPEIEGVKAFPSLAETPEAIDYAYVAIGAEQIPDVLGQANGRVRFAQVISSGFGEVEGGQQLEAELVRKAHQGGCRVLGPNCLGLYSPRGGITFPEGAPTTLGTVGVLSQSGGLGTDIIKRGQWRGLAFSGLVTIGNSADIGPSDLLEFLFQDEQTRVIGLYLEDVKDGRRFFELMRSSRATKPVVILKGGRSALGRAAAASHTGALAGDDRAWQALTRQTGCVLVQTVDRFIDALLALQFLTLRPERPTSRIVLFGNGGGTSVLATDLFARLGLAIEPFGEGARQSLEALNLPPGTSIANPIDAPVRTMQERDGAVPGEILDIVHEQAAPDAIVMHLNLSAFVGRGDKDPVDALIAAAVERQRAHAAKTHFMLVLRVDGSPELDARKRAVRTKAIEEGVPVYDEMADAAHALAALSQLEKRFGEKA